MSTIMTSPMHEIDHVCGHTQEHDLVNVAKGKRAGRIKWLETTDCKACWITKNKKEFKKEQREVNVKVLQEVLEQAKKDDLPSLIGSEKQIEWALKIRFELLKNAYSVFVETTSITETEYENTLLVPARAIMRAGWWIDNRDERIETLSELLTDSGEENTAENPF